MSIGPKILSEVKALDILGGHGTLKSGKGNSAIHHIHQILHQVRCLVRPWARALEEKRRKRPGKLHRQLCQEGRWDSPSNYVRALTVGGQGDLGGSRRTTDKGVMKDSAANSPDVYGAQHSAQSTVNWHHRSVPLHFSQLPLRGACPAASATVQDLHWLDQGVPWAPNPAARSVVSCRTQSDAGTTALPATRPHAVRCLQASPVAPCVPARHCLPILPLLPGVPVSGPEMLTLQWWMYGVLCI